MVVRELLTKLGFKLDNASVAKAERATERVKDGAEKAATAFRNVALALGGMAALSQVGRIADQMQSLRARIEALPQTVGDAGLAFDELARHANSTRMDIDAYGALYTRVGNAAKDYIKTQDDLLNITDTIGNALVVGGTKGAEAAAVMTQFSQALASGVLQGDEFRSMAEAAPQYLDKLSETLKIPRTELKKMAADGKLTAKSVIEATRQMSGYFQEKMLRMPLGISDAMTIIGNRWAQMIDKMNRKSGAVTKIANLFLSGFDRIEQGIGWLVEKLGGAENAVQLLGIAVAVVAAGMAIAFAPMIASLAPVIALIAVLSLAIQDLWVWIEGGDSVIGQMIGPWSEWRDTVMGAIDMVLDVLGSLWDFVTSVARALKALFQGDPDAFRAAMDDVMSAFMDFVSAIVPLLWGAFKAALYVIWTLFTGMWSAIGTMIVTGLRAAWDNAYSAFSGFLAKIKAGFSAWVASAAAEAVKIIPGGGLIAAGITGVQKLVTPSQMTSKGTGQGGTTVHNTTVHQTLPPGTSKETAAAAKKATEQALNTSSSKKQARDMAAYAR